MALRHPFGDARFPVRHSAAKAEVPPCHQATHPRNEVSTLSGDLTVIVLKKKCFERKRREL